MNFTTIALLLLAWQMLKPKQSAPQQNAFDDVLKMLNEDTIGLLQCLTKLNDKNCTADDKQSALFQMLTNPTVLDLFGKMFSQQQQAPMQNQEGYVFEQPSKDSQDFFRPIENIADAEVKHKLYWFYDNWYLKK